jgi:predicted DNA-binding transcriptional regulator
MSSLNIKEQFHRLGLSGEEILICEHVLTYGRTKISDMSKKIGIKRSTLYLRISSLEAKGFLKRTTLGRGVFISFANPNTLKESIKKEKYVVRQKELVVDQLMPILKAAQTSDGLFSTENLTGREGFKSLIDKIIAEKANLYWIGSFEKILEVLGDESFFRLMTWRRMSQKTVSYAITDSSILVYKKYTGNIGTFREIKIIDNLEQEKSVFVAFGDYFALIDLSQGVHIVLNKTKTVSQMFKLIHSLLRGTSARA